MEVYEEKQQNTVFQSVQAFGWREVFIVIYSFILVEPVKIIVAELFTNNWIAIRLMHDEKKGKMAKVKKIIAYIIVVLWLIWCYLGIVIISIILEDRYNSSQMWVSSYIITIVSNFIFVIHAKALIWAAFFKCRQRCKETRKKKRKISEAKHNRRMGLRSYDDLAPQDN